MIFNNIKYDNITLIFFNNITINIITLEPTPQAASSAAHMYVCGSKLRDVV